MASVMALEPGDCVLIRPPGGGRKSLIRAVDLAALEGLGVLANPVALEREHG